MMPDMNATMLAASSSPGVSIAVKSTVVLALALTGACLARGSRAAVRHALLLTSFGVLPVLSIASLVAPPVHIFLTMPAHEPTLPAPSTATLDTSAPSTPAVADVAVAPATTRWSSVSASDLLVAGWLAGVVIFLLPLVLGLRQVRSLRRSALPWRQGQSAVAELASEAASRRRVAVLVHEELPGPMTCGVLRPAILLPPDAQAWQEDDLDRALVHELEHVRRGDWLSHCLARAVCAVYWFHPLVWIAWRRLSLEAERSCDDAVLGRSEATAYADQLVGLAQRLSASAKSPTTNLPFLAMANRADLSARVGAVLDSRQNRGRAGALAVMLACAAAAMVVVAVAPLKMVAAPQQQPPAPPQPATPQQPPAPQQPANRGAAPAVAPVAPPPQSAAPVPAAAPRLQFRSTTRLVMVDVTVTDSNGKSVEGLSKDDFVITEDDRRQFVDVFEFQNLTGAALPPSSYYVLGYYTSNTSSDGSYRKIKVALKDTSTGNVARARNPETRLEFRSGYFGPSPDPAIAGAAPGGATAIEPGITPPIPISRVEAQYSEEARKAKWSGTVVLNIEVDATGHVTGVHVIRPSGFGLDEKAIEAVSKWRFLPAKKDGNPVAAQAEVDMTFRLL